MAPADTNEQIDAILERVNREFQDGTTQFRRRLLELQREHMHAYDDAVMRSRLAYIRLVDRLLNTLLRLDNARQNHPLITILRSVLRRHLGEVDRADDQARSFRRQSMHVSFRDLIGDFNMELYREINDANGSIAE